MRPLTRGTAAAAAGPGAANTPAPTIAPSPITTASKVVSRRASSWLGRAISTPYRSSMSEFQRGAVRLHILHHACEDEIHGAWIRDELAEHGHHISPGTLYPVLHRLEAGGLLSSREQVVDSRVRRLYRATPAGHTELKACRRALAELAEEVLLELEE